MPVVFRFAMSILIIKQFVTLLSGKSYIGVIKERSQIIEKDATAHALEIDEYRFVAADHDILGLEIAMDETGRQT